MKLIAVYCNDCGKRVENPYRFRNCKSCMEKVKAGTMFSVCQRCGSKKHNDRRGLCPKCAKEIAEINANSYD